MKKFAQLFQEWDQSNCTLKRTVSLRRYYERATTSDSIWATYFLLGNHPKSLLQHSTLLSFGIKESGLPSWLFEESYHAVGDLSETIVLLLENSPGGGENFTLSEMVDRFVLPLPAEEDPELLLREGFFCIPKEARLPFLKLITGSFRAGVSKGIVIKALSDLLSLPKAELAGRLSGSFEPTAEAWARLTAPAGSDLQPALPYLLSEVLPKSSTRAPRIFPNRKGA